MNSEGNMLRNGSC